MAIEGSRLTVESSGLNEQELRFALLFWDRLVWPILKNFRLEGGGDEAFLQQTGILSRPAYAFEGSVAEAVARAQIQAFLDLDQREPGLWALAQGENALLLKDRILEVGRGALVELNRAIPVPDKDVPLDDILEFKMKRRDDLLRLRKELDSLFTVVNDATDKQFELRRHIQQIDSSCADLLQIAKESKVPFRLSDLQVSFEIQPVSLIAAFLGWHWGVEHEMPLAAATVAGAATSLKINKDFGLRRSKIRASPYRYVYRFHKEVF